MLSHPRASRCLVLVVLAVALAAPSLSAGRSNVRAAELEQAQTAVIAQGVARLPGPSTAWSVERSTVLPVGENNAQGHVLGFSIADRSGFSVTDEDTGARTRLSHGEALFNADDSNKTYGSLGDERTDRLMIELWSTEPNPVPTTDAVLFVGESFDTPSGDRDIDLLTAVVDDETSLSLESSKAPALVYAPDGLRYGVEGAPDQILAPGEAKEFRGAVTLFAPTGQRATSSGRARVYAAVIGSALSTEETSEPTSVESEENGTAELTVFLVQCPGGTLAMPGVRPGESPCQPDGSGADVSGDTREAQNVPVTFRNVGTGAEFTLTTDGSGAIEETVQAGTYRIVTFRDVAASSRAVVSECSERGTNASRSDLVLEDLVLTDGDAVSCAMYADGGVLGLPDGGEEVVEPAADGTITFEVRSCPEEYVDFPDDVPSQVDGLVSCDGDLSLDETSPVDAAQVTLNGPDGSVAFQFTGPDGVVVFTGLAEGDYTAVLIYGTSTLPSRSQCGGQTADGIASGLLGPISTDQPQELPPGGSLRCTFLTRYPTVEQAIGSSLNVRVLSCPDGTNLPTVQADGVYDCGGFHVDAGLEVVAVGPGGASQGGFTDGDGLVTLELSPGRYALSFPGLEGSAYGICGVPGMGLSGLIDAFEVGVAETVECTVQLLNPADAGAAQSVDSDGDYLTDPQEDRLGTDPDDPDTDGDGALDGSEVYAGTDPLT